MLDVQSVENGQMLTLVLFLRHLEQTHPLFEREQLNAKIAREQQKSLTGAEDWAVSSGVNVSHMSYSPATMGLERSNGLSLSCDVSRHLWSTGGNLSAGINLAASALDYSSENSYASTPDANYDNNISLSYTQPLLKNWKGVLSRLEYDLKAVEINLEEVQALENQEDFLSSSALSFLDWVFYIAKMQIVQERLQLSMESLDEIQQKRARNLVDEVDVIRSKNSVSLSQQDRVNVRLNLSSLVEQLAILTQDTELADKSPQYNLYEIHKLPEPQVGTKQSDDSFPDALIMDKPEATLSLTYAFPLKNTQAQADLMAKDLQIDQLNAQTRELEITQISMLSNICIQLEQMEEILKLNRQQIDLARQKTVEEQTTYNRGRGDLTYVIQSQDEEGGAKLTYALNALRYQKLYIQYLALTDQLLLSE
jgi:outer membrane protein TolC